ncbi:hypothetical protein KDW_56070 [Dictyobacter vulcani]|uniref:Uncharacterized protein n=1 Tax=Dictyobacter vulcani TaxID=2607529 RepID=A0A5J4KU67_9CHLR|nr:zinc ribbon domain-containing protein [Dictyobacter vulcani]GER91445.1 hypothetical protein KDW_56070 [Dictyobacter vulcani]
MLFCPKCHTELPDQARTCHNCGFHPIDATHIVATATREQDQPATTPPPQNVSQSLHTYTNQESSLFPPTPTRRPLNPPQRPARNAGPASQPLRRPGFKTAAQLDEHVHMAEQPDRAQEPAKKLTLTQRYSADQPTSMVAAAPNPTSNPGLPVRTETPIRLKTVDNALIPAAQARAIQNILRPAYIASTNSVIQTRRKARPIQHRDFWIFFAVIVGLIGLLCIYIFASYHGPRSILPHQQTRIITLAINHIRLHM